MIDDITDSGNFTWNSAFTTTGNFTLSTAGTDSYTFYVNGTVRAPIIPDKNWMPYTYFEYEPRWHKKYARYKIQMSKMWD